MNNPFANYVPEISENPRRNSGSNNFEQNLPILDMNNPFENYAPEISENPGRNSDSKNFEPNLPILDMSNPFENYAPEISKNPNRNSGSKNFEPNLPILDMINPYSKPIEIDIPEENFLNSMEKSGTNLELPPTKTIEILTPNNGCLEG